MKMWNKPAGLLIWQMAIFSIQVDDQQSNWLWGKTVYGTIRFFTNHILSPQNMLIKNYKTAFSTEQNSFNGDFFMIQIPKMWIKNSMDKIMWSGCCSPVAAAGIWPDKVKSLTCLSSMPEYLNCRTRYCSKPEFKLNYTSKKLPC